MHYNVIRTIGAAAVLAAGAAAGEQWSGPLSGFVFDREAVIFRAVVGVPGAASLGRPVPAAVKDALVAPNGRAAVAAQDGQVVVIADLAQPDQYAALSGLPLDVIRQASWAPDSSALLFYSPARHTVQRAVRAGTTWRVDRAIDCSGISGEVAAFGVSRQGKWIVLAVAGEAGGIYLVTSDAPPLRLYPATEPRALAFSSRGDDAYVADAGTNQIVAFRNLSPANTDIQILAGEPDGVQRPTVLAAAPDGSSLYWINESSQRLSIFPFTSRAVTASLELPVPFTALQLFSDSALYLLNPNRKAQEPLWILSGGENPAVYFVPNGGAE
jgi:hypothetical protein